MEGGSSPPRRIGDLRCRRYPKAYLFENGVALNQTAYEILSLCDGSTSAPEIVRRLGERFGLPDQVARADVLQTLHDLVEGGLIEWTRGDP